MKKSYLGFFRRRRFQRDEVGASAVEFGMFAPILLFGVLMTVDIGMALSERMDMDHIVRAGAESAMVKHDEDGVLKVMQSTASENFELAPPDSEGGSQLSLTADRFCACGDGGVVSCSIACTGDLPPNVFFDVGATKTYSGLIIPYINFNAGMRVQLR